MRTLRLPLLVAFVALAMAPSPLLLLAEEEDDGAIGFIRPRNNMTALGPTEIELHVRAPEGVGIERVEIWVDGNVLIVLRKPPWTKSWNAGDGSVGHRIEAVVRFDDGSELREQISTSKLLVHHIEQVDLVNLYLVVRDGAGRYVTDLGRDDFRILEDRRPQSIERFSTTHKPLRVGIVLDSSLSMKRSDRLEKAQRAALQFLEILEPQDEGMVVTFSDRVHVDQELTADQALLAAAIERAVAGGGTALYDSIWRTSRLLAGFDGRRVLVLLSDGRDESANGFEAGSLHTLEEAREQALRNDVMVFPIGLGNNLDREYVRRWGNLGGLSNLDTDKTLLDVLNEIAASTGGRAVIAKGAGNLKRAFGEIASDLRNQYSIAYVSDDPTHDGRWRRVDVETPGQTLEVITRKGYYASKPERKRKN